MNNVASTYARKKLVLEYDKSLGRAIATLRGDQHLSQGTVAKGFGCEQPLISKLEAGQRSRKFSEVTSLARALGVPRERLVDALLEALDTVEM